MSEMFRIDDKEKPRCWWRWSLAMFLIGATPFLAAILFIDLRAGSGMYGGINPGPALMLLAVIWAVMLHIKGMKYANEERKSGEYWLGVIFLLLNMLVPIFVLCVLIDLRFAA